jgi:hypothetical protein
VNPFSKPGAIAGAVAIVLASEVSHALPPTVVPDYTLYAAGSSEQANAFYVAANTILTNLDSYTDQSDGSESVNFCVVFGSTKAAFSFNGATVPAGKNVLYFYKTAGNDFGNGIAPQVGAGSAVNYPTPASVLGTAVTTGAAAGTGAPTYKYTRVLLNFQIPDWGLSDMEVKIFQHFNNPTGDVGGTTQDTDGGPPVAPGATTAIYDNLFGIAVTSKVFTGTHPKTSFSKAEIEGILAGNVSDWIQLSADDGTELAAGGIIFLDRAEGSGTKAASSQYFLNYPGDVNRIADTAIAPFSAGNPYNGTNLGTVTAEQALDIAEISTGAIVSDLLLAQSRGLRAISVLGLENPPAFHLTAGTVAYDFVKINSMGVDTGTAGDNINGTVATSYINAVKGYYDFYYQGSFNTRTGVLTGTTVGDLFAKEFQMVFSQLSFVGAFANQSFPNAVPGTLIDADVASALTTGVTLNSRNKVSPNPLQNIFPVPAGGIPVSKDPL